MLGVFHFITTILPTFRPDCSYQSPQALGIFLVLEPLRRVLIRASKTASPYFTTSFLARIDHSRNFMWHKLSALVPKRGTHRSSWHAREKAAADAHRAHLDRGLVMTAYDVTLIDTVLHTSLGPCMWDMQPGCIRKCYDDVFGKRLQRLPWPNKDDWSPAAPLILNFSLLAARDGHKVAHPEVLHETVLDMPTPDVSAESEVGGLFLQTMARLVLHRDDAWSRRAFDKLVWYLYMTGIKDDAALRPEVIHDAIAAFPRSIKTFRKVVDHENSHLNMPYLSVAECVLRYLAQHTAISPEDALEGEKNIQDMLAAVLVFIRFPGWAGKRTRLQYVLWELHDSGIIPSIVKLREDVQTRDLTTARVATAFRNLLTLVDEELLSDSWLGEFWRDKFDSVNEALVRLEALFDKGDLEGEDVVMDLDDGVSIHTTQTLQSPYPTVSSFGPSRIIAAPGSVIAYPISSLNTAEYSETTLSPLVAVPADVIGSLESGPLTQHPRGWLLCPCRILWHHSR
ncbi:hypothetical protein C8T65DRAFT_240257 [Cerioporus squamosus]|nr:hypothetical protein C8T65DRAFT_240257 [Cerioporus squamosus]